MRDRIHVPRHTLASKPDSGVSFRVQRPSFPVPLAPEASALPPAPAPSAGSRLAPVWPLGEARAKPGLPETLRSGMEHLSGLTLDDVAVHYNSAEPGRHQALAYTKGRDIHLGPGQEKHLPHEAWHVVQQRQGRVTPTLRVADHRINDDPALEREASEMGSQALRLHAKEPMSQGLRHSPAPAQPVMQMMYKVRTSEKHQEDLIRWNQDVASDMYSVYWVSKLEEIYQHIEELSKVLEDDDDLAELQRQEAGIDRLAAKLDRLNMKFIRTPAFLEERQLRSPKSPPKKEPGSKPRRTPKKRVSKKEPKPKPQLTRHEVAQEIDRMTLQLGQRFQELKAIFPLSEGGFSAKGRAHAMNETPGYSLGSDEVKTWFEGIRLGNAQLSTTKSVYKPAAKVDEAASQPVLPAALNNVPGPQKLLGLEHLIGKPLDGEQKIEVSRAPAPQDRGAGQLANMGGANASAYAALSGVGNWQQSRWEWLHVRAASLGGKTDGSNLVVGTRDANTHMMPVESNIRQLGNIVNENPSRYKKLEARFAVAGQAPDPARHKVNEIKLSWKLIKADAAPGTVKDVKGEAKFNPLRTDASLSKTEVGILETALKEEREKATTD